MSKRILPALILSIAAIGALAASIGGSYRPAVAQAPVFCPTRPPGDNTNACASTAFVIANAGPGGGVSSVSNSDGTLTISPTTGAVVASLALGHANTWTANQSFASGTFRLNGSSSGTTIVQPAATASGTITVPAATDTLVGKATTDTFTNKTFDTAGTGNSFSINGVAVTANTGTGAVVRASSPTLVTPTLGVASATSINGLTVSATTGTLTVPNGVVLTGPASSATVAGVGIANTFTGANSFSGVTTFSGALVVAMRTVTAAGAVTVSATTDYFVCINKTVGAATQVDLPGSPTTGATFLIKDCKGDAATNNITIVPAAGLIDGAANSVLSTNYASVAVTYNGAGWSVN